MWDWPIWGTLALAGVATIATLALLAVRALAGWRDFKRSRRRVLGQLDHLAAAGETTMEKAAAAGDSVELQRSLARLRVALTRLAVLRGALDEAQDALGRLTAFVPR